jgi:hypothetical protein
MVGPKPAFFMLFLKQLSMGDKNKIAKTIIFAAYDIKPKPNRRLFY